MIGTAISFDLLPTGNGAFNAYVIWFATVAVELIVMLRLIFGPEGTDDLPPPRRTPVESTGG